MLTDYKTSKSAVSYDEARESLQLAIYYRAAQVYDDLKKHGEPRPIMELVYPGIERHDRDDGSITCDRRVQRPDASRGSARRAQKHPRRRSGREVRAVTRSGLPVVPDEDPVPAVARGKEMPR